MSDEKQAPLLTDEQRKHFFETGELPNQAEINALFEQGEAPKPPPKADPAIVAYVKHKWEQPLAAFRTACFRCGKDSPVIFVPPGQIAFGGPTDRDLPDVTAAVQNELTKHDWRFELRRAYCPTCKGLGVSS